MKKSKKSTSSRKKVTTRSLNVSDQKRRPVCLTEDKHLGLCMSYNDADRIARAHSDSTGHEVDLESC